MTSGWRSKIGKVALGLAVVLLAGCASASAPPSVDVTGNWSGTWHFPGSLSGTIRLALMQKAARVSGEMVTTGFTMRRPDGAITGVVEGQRVLLLIPTGRSRDLRGQG